MRRIAGLSVLQLDGFEMCGTGHCANLGVAEDFDVGFGFDAKGEVARHAFGKVTRRE